MADSKSEIVVESYQASWADDFAAIRAVIWPVLHDVAESIQHVGSTSVPGLAAKPIIDIDVVVSELLNMPSVIERLKSIGYVHRGDLGIKGREAFHAPENSIRQNFYVCVSGSLALRNHLILRDHLLNSAEARQEYGELKQKFATEFANDIDSYVEAKTELILKFLALHGVPETELSVIRVANLKPLHVERAKLTDVDELLALIIDLSRWLRSRGIFQWSDGYPREKIESDIRSNFVYVVREDGVIAATVTLSDQKDGHWRDFPEDAIYLRRLAVQRLNSGKNMGSRLLAWSEAEVQKRGIQIMRLDCDARNRRLRHYYSSLGFQFCGARRVEEYDMEFALYEKVFRNDEGR